MMSFLKLFLILTPLLVLADLLWLGVVMKDFYRANLGHLMSGSVAWAPAIVFYLLFTFGLLYFAITPTLSGGSLFRSVIAATIFGLVAYGTYDLTNQATLREWPTLVTIVDMLWGAFLSGVLGAVAYWSYLFWK